jgi:DNA-binding transcriptional MocR family regulator
MDTKWLPTLATGGRSKYRALSDSIRNGIANGDLRGGQKLPPVRDLAFRLQVTPGTVARAYSILVEEGVLRAGVGRGTFVAEPKAAVRAPSWPQTISMQSPVLADVGQSMMIREALAHVSTDIDDDALMQLPSRARNFGARQAFRKWMADAPVGAFTEENVVITHGAQNAILHILMTVLTGPSPVVLVDELSFPGFRRAAELCRAQVIGVPWDEEGPCVDTLTRLARETGAQIYCTSAEVGNPTTQCTTAARRREVAAVANRFGMHVIDDDCYRNGIHQAESYRVLLPELGWYVTSPSKSISPALRIGFAIAPRGFAGAITRGLQYSHFGVATPLCDLYTHVMNNPKLPTVLCAMRQRMNEDVRIAVNHLGGHKVRWRQDVSILWLELPERWRVGPFAQAAEAAGVLIKPADEFVLRDGRAVHAVRLAVNGQIAQERFEEGIVILQNLLDNPPRSFTG